MSRNLLPRTREGRIGLATTAVLSLGALAYVAELSGSSNKSLHNADSRTEQGRNLTANLCEAFFNSGQNHSRFGDDIITSYSGRVIIRKTSTRPINLRKTPLLQQREEGNANQDSNLKMRIGDPDDSNKDRSVANQVEFKDPVVIITNGNTFIGADLLEPGSSVSTETYKSPSDCAKNLEWAAVGSMETGGRYSGAYVEWLPDNLPGRGTIGMGADSYKLSNGQLTGSAGNIVATATYSVSE